MHNWKRLPHQESHKIGWRHVMIKKFIDPDGNEQEFGIYDKEGAAMAAVIALTPSNEVVVARQFRHGPEMIMDELPGGGVEPGEDPKDAALRELEEETGYKAGRIKPLGIARKEAYRNGVHHYFIAYDCVKHEDPNPDPGEFTEPVIISVVQLIENAKKAKMTDSAAILLAYEELLELCRALDF